MNNNNSMSMEAQHQQRQLALQLLDNPMVQQMMQQTLQENPDLFRSMLQAQQPQLFQQLFGNGGLPPELANQFLQTMMQPETMRNMLQWQERQYGGGGAAAAAAPQQQQPQQLPLDFANLLTEGPLSPSAQPPGANASGAALDFGSLLQSLQASSSSAVSSSMSPRPGQPAAAADRFRFQLQSLYDMGFDDELANVAALEAVGGNVNRAVDRLLSQPPAATVHQVATTSDSSAETTTADAGDHSDNNSNNNNDTPEPPAPPKDAAEKKND